MFVLNFQMHIQMSHQGRPWLAVPSDIEALPGGGKDGGL